MKLILKYTEVLAISMNHLSAMKEKNLPKTQSGRHLTTDQLHVN